MVSLCKIDALFWMMIAAIGAAITTFSGQNYGAHLHDRIKRVQEQPLLWLSL